MKGKRKEFEFDATELISKCLQFIETRAYEVVAANEFLNLDGDLVLQIAKNDKICVEEVELFNGIAKWAKSKAAKEGTDVKLLISPIIPFIRFPLMTTKDLLKVVRPTGLCPRKEYLEAIEYKALPHLFKDVKDIRFKDRFELFHGTTVLNLSQSLALNEFVGVKQKEWKLLYKATRDNFTGQSFHQKCDGKGNTVVVVKSANGNIFGGYSPCKWASNGAYAYDQSSFLFSLVNSLGKPLKFVHSGSNLNSIYGNAGYGPTYGSGHDLHICNNSNTTAGSYTNASYSFPMTDLPGYTNGTDNSKNIFAGGYNFMTTEIEVFE